MKSDSKGPWIALYRKTGNSDTFLSLSCAERSIFLQSFFLAAGMEYDCTYNGRHYHLLPGQFVISQRDLAEQCGEGCTRQIVRDTIRKLVALGTWTHNRTQSGTRAPSLITFINWGVYQHSPTHTTQSTTHRTTQSQPNEGTQPPMDSGENDALQGSYKDDTKGSTTKSESQPVHHKFKIPHVVFDPMTLQLSGIDDEARRAFSAACPKANLDDCLERLKAWIIKKGVAYENYWRTLCTIGSGDQTRGGTHGTDRKRGYRPSIEDAVFTGEDFIHSS